MVALGRTLKKNEECEIELLWELDNSSGKAEPFLAATIREPTEELVLKVTLPQHAPNAICEVRTNGSVLLPLETKEFPFDRHHTAEWPIPNPKLLHNYQIRWHK